MYLFNQKIWEIKNLLPSLQVQTTVQMRKTNKLTNKTKIIGNTFILK